MSAGNAREFMTKVYARDRKALTLVAKGSASEGFNAQEIAEIAKAAQDAGWEFTADELQEAYLDSLEMTELNEDEFADVAGATLPRLYNARILATKVMVLADARRIITFRSVKQRSKMVLSAAKPIMTGATVRTIL